MEGKKRADLSKVIDGNEVMFPAFELSATQGAEGRARDLYMQCFVPTDDRLRWYSAVRAEWPKVATILRDRIVFYPVHTNPYAQRYLNAQHPPFFSITYLDNSTHELPEDADAARAQINLRLPWGIFEDSERSFGLSPVIDEVWRVLGHAFRTSALTISASGDETHKDGNNLVIAVKDLDKIRRAMNRINRRKNDGVRREKGTVVFAELLTKLDPAKFVLRQQELVEVTSSTHSNVIRRITREAGRRSVASVRNTLPTLAAHEPEVLMSLHSEIERVTLAEMIARYEELLAQDLPEPKWQKFFENNHFVLSLAFSRPVRLLHTQFHAQGSTISGDGAQVGDFLFRELSQGLALVEIKKPGTELMRSRPYRNTAVYAPTDDLSGALTQTLLQRSDIHKNWQTHQNQPTLSGAMPDSIKCVIVAGRTPLDSAKLRSFELIRGACKDVDILTFDELLEKLRQTLVHLTPPKSSSAEGVYVDDVPF